MTVDQSIEQQVLDLCNAVRVAFNQPPLDTMPRGRCGEDENCPVHRTLEGIGLGRFKVDIHQVIVARSAAQVIARAWGMPICTLPSGSHDPVIEPLAVELPPAMTTFIAAMDDEGLPHLIDARRTLAATSA